MGDYETALINLTKCKDMSRHINNLRLNLDSLICISNIKFKMKNEDIPVDPVDAKDLFHEALEYAEELDDSKYSLNCLASLGILDGEHKFGQFLQQVKAGQIGNLSGKFTGANCLRKSTVQGGTIKPEIDFQDS